MTRRWTAPAVLLGATVFLVYCGRDESTPVAVQGNQMPVIRGVTVDPPTILSGGSAKLAVDASDPDGEELQFSWTSASGSAITGDSVATYTHNGSSTTSDTITVTVTDSGGGSAMQEAMITIDTSAVDRPGNGGPGSSQPAPTPTPQERPGPDPGPSPEPTVPPTPAPPSTPAPAPTPTPTPTPIPPPTISLSGGGSCHPTCNVTFNASGSNYTSLSWGGCCSGGGASSSCGIPRPGTYTCSVTATGPGGTATASRDAEGTNATPAVNPRWFSCGGGDCWSNMDGEYTFDFGDDDGALTFEGGAGGTCRHTGTNGGTVSFRTETGPGDCVVSLKVCDPWGACGESYGYFNVPAP